MAATCKHGAEPSDGAYKTSRIPWLAENLLASEEEICVMNLGVMPLTFPCVASPAR
jgi:hypothetical protein